MHEISDIPYRFPQPNSCCVHQRGSHIICGTNDVLQVIAGAGANCTKKAVHLTEQVNFTSSNCSSVHSRQENAHPTTVCKTMQAKELGCDGVLSVIPYYNKPTQVGTGTQQARKPPRAPAHVRRNAAHVPGRPRGGPRTGPGFPPRNQTAPFRTRPSGPSERAGR